MEMNKGMEARLLRAALLAAVLLVSMGARYRSPNFIVDTPDAAFSQQVARAAEKYRRELAVEWLGREMPNWSQPCVMTVQVGRSLGAGGATTFVFDRGEVFGWRMSIQGSRQRILDSVLPHEITHMIFASHFRRPLPRWADEGGATSVEHASERNRHRRMLIKFLRSGRGIAFGRMFAMQQYPRDIMPLYAQGYSLAEYLIQQGGKRKYVKFIGDGLAGNNWAAALQRHYGISSLGGLQNNWLAWVRQGSPLTKPQQASPTTRPQQDRPSAVPPPEMVAVKERLPRPQPNLIYRTRNQQPAAYAPGSTVAAEEPAPAKAAGEAAATGLASCQPPGTAKQLPSTGWHAAGATPIHPPAAAATQPPPTDPFRAQVTRPQPIERSRQIILEWGSR